MSKNNLFVRKVMIEMAAHCTLIRFGHFIGYIHKVGRVQNVVV